jgi:hypothetical protein
MNVEIIKIILIICGFICAVPFIGTVLNRRPQLRGPALGILILLTALPENWITLTVFSQDWYRGHVRGFEFSAIDIWAAGMIMGLILTARSHTTHVIPIILTWLLYCILCLPSLINALDSWLWGTAVIKYLKACLPLAAVFLAIQTKRDIQWLIYGIATALILEMAPAFTQKYIFGVWRVSAWFEHSNPLAMWAYMVGLPAFGAALMPHISRRLGITLFVSYLCACSLIVTTFARASLAAIGLGTIAIIAITIVIRPSLRIVIASAFVILGSLVMLSIAGDSIIERMEKESTATPHEDFRSVLNRQSAGMLTDHALGVGWNNYGLANSRPHGLKYSLYVEEWNRLRGHRVREADYHNNALTESLYWLHLAEVGYPGFIGYMLFHIISVMYLMLALWRNRSTPVFSFLVAIAVALALAYGHGLFERILVQTKNLALWMILLGIVVRLANKGTITWNTSPQPRIANAQNSDSQSMQLL